MVESRYTRFFISNQVGEVEMTNNKKGYAVPIHFLPDGFAYHRIITDNKGTPIDYIILEVNEAFEQITGLKRDELVDKRATEVFPFIQNEEFDWIGTCGKVALEGNGINLEQYSQFLEKCYAVTIYSDQPGYFGTIFQDITYPREAEKRLRKGEEKYRAMFDQSVTGLYLHDLKGNIVEANQMACEQVGYTQEELLDMTVFELHPKRGDTVNMPREEIKRQWKQWEPGQRYTLEAEHQRKDGTIFPVYISTGKLRYEDNELLLAVVHDVTEFKQAEKALLDSNKLLAKSQEIAHVGSWILEVEDNRLTWSDEVYRIFGLQPGNFKATYEAFLEAVHPDDREKVDRVYKDSLKKDKEGYDIEHKILHKHSGEVRYVHEKCTHERNREGTVIRSIGIVQDITERKQFEMELKEMQNELEERVKERTAELEQANKELDAFTYSVSHDLRAPLRHIIGFSQILLEDYSTQLEQQASDYLKRMSASAMHMSNLIEDLLKLSRVTRQELEREPVELSALIRAYLNELCEKEPERCVETVIAPDQIITGDTALMRLAITNLLDNAWKYTTASNPARIEFGVIEEEAGKVFYIADNGTGFDMNYADKLFTPFQRLHSNPEYTGTGIGLSIVSRVIKKHGGNIWVDSKPGEGTTVYFIL